MTSAWKKLVLLLGASVVAMPVSAAELVPADPWEVIHVAREAGEASVSRDRFRDPVIQAESDGVKYQIDFYGCRLGRDCDTLLFRARLLNALCTRRTPSPGTSDAASIRAIARCCESIAPRRAIAD